MFLATIVPTFRVQVWALEPELPGLKAVPDRSWPCIIPGIVNSANVGTLSNGKIIWA